MNLRFQLTNYDIKIVDYEGEKTEKQIERDIENFNEFIEAKRNKYADRLDEIDDYRYELSNLSENEFIFNLAALSVLEEEFEICFIEYEEF